MLKTSLEGSPSAANVQGVLHVDEPSMGRKKRKNFLKFMPRTLYIYRPVLNGREIFDWAKSVGFESTLPPEDMHVTIVYSKTPVDWNRIGVSPIAEIDVVGGDRAITQFNDDATVLCIESSELGARWRQALDDGASYDYASYKPHVTISYLAPKEAVLWEPYRGLIRLGPEVLETITPGAQDNIIEKIEQVSKAQVAYRGSPKGSQYCSKCSMFREPSACILVKGSISSTGWCTRFDAISKSNGTGGMQKAGARHSKADNEMIQSQHDTAVKLGAVCSGRSSQEDIDKFRIAKVDENLGLVFGYAIICKANGEDYFDLNVDIDSGQRVPEHIPEVTMLKSATDFMQNSRSGNEMHGGPDKGTYVFAFPLTTDIAKALGIQTNVTGLLVGFKPPPDLLAKFKDGTYKGFSIEGRRLSVQDIE